MTNLSSVNFEQWLSSQAQLLSKLERDKESFLKSEVAQAQEIGEYALVGGKMMRGIISWHVAMLVGVEPERASKLACGIEFLHCATLIHDDVVDQSVKRRERPSAFVRYGNAASVLVGDYVYARSSQLFTQLHSLELVAEVAKVSLSLSEGELLQLILNRQPEMSTDSYYSIIGKKTASLFSLAAISGMILKQKSEVHFREFGYQLGLAFQIMDDVVDYLPESICSTSGKVQGRDYFEGKVTLPLILLACKPQVPADVREQISDLIANNDVHSLAQLQAAMIEHNIFAACLEVATKYAATAHAHLQQALAQLTPESNDARLSANALLTLSQCVVLRESLARLDQVRSS